MYTKGSEAQDGVNLGTVDRAIRTGRSIDGVEPGHTPRPRVGRRVRMLLSFQRPSHLFGRGFLLRGAPENRTGSRSGPMSIAPHSRLGKTRADAPREFRAFGRTMGCGPFGHGRRDPTQSGPGPVARPFTPITPAPAPWPLRASQDRTWTVTVRERGRSSKSISTTCCQVPSASRPSTTGIVSDGPITAARRCAWELRVVVEPVVLVVAVGRDQAVEQRLEIVDAAGLVLHRRDRDGRPGGEHAHHAAVDPRGAHDADDPGGDVDDVPVAGRLEAQQAAVDGHRDRPRVRARARSAACRAAGPCRRRRDPGRRGPVGHRLPVEPDPALGERAARLGGRDPERAREQRRQVHRPFRASHSTTGHVLGTSWRSNVDSRTPARPPRPVRPVEPRDERPGQRPLGVPRADPVRNRPSEQQLVPRAERRVGDAQRLAVDLVGRLGDADVVADRLGHLALAVGSDQQRHRQDHLLGLPVQ